MLIIPFGAIRYGDCSLSSATKVLRGLPHSVLPPRCHACSVARDYENITGVFRKLKSATRVVDERLLLHCASVWPCNAVEHSPSLMLCVKQVLPRFPRNSHPLPLNARCPLDVAGSGEAGAMLLGLLDVVRDVRVAGATFSLRKLDAAHLGVRSVLCTIEVLWVRRQPGDKLPDTSRQSA